MARSIRWATAYFGLLLSVAATICQPLVALAADTSFQTALYETLARNELLDRHLQNLMERIFSKLLADARFPLPLRLNQPYVKGALNVYVIELSDRPLDRLSVANYKVRQTLHHSRNNVLALPPDMMVFDGDFVAHIILNTQNELFALSQGFAEAGARKSLTTLNDADHELEKHSVINDVYRFGTIRASRDGQHKESPSRNFVKFAGSSLADAWEMFTFAFAPIFYHELGHLQDNTYGHFFGKFGKLIQQAAQYFASPKILQHEEAADRYAVTQLERLFSQELKAHASNRLLALRDYQSAAATVKLLRDIVLFDVFEGFHGLHAEDYFIDIVHQPCQKKPHTAELGFYDPAKIFSASWHFTPMLRSEEFERLRDKIDTGIRSATHAHHFTRGDRVIAALDRSWLDSGSGGGDTLMRSYLLFLEAMRTNDPRVLYEVADVKQSLGLSFQQLARHLDLDFQRAVTCPGELCRVGLFKSGEPGVVEIIGRSDNLAMVRLVYPLLGTNPEAVLSGKHPAGDVPNLSFLRSFVLNALAVPADSPDQAEVMAPFEDLVAIARKCGALTLTSSYKDRSILLTTVNQDLWVNVVVLPRSAPASMLVK